PSTRNSSASRAGASSSCSSSPVSVFGDISASLRPVDIVAFTDEYVDGAAAVLAERHASHLAVEPLLPRPTDFVGPVMDERVDATGAVALEGGEVVGFLLGKRREDSIG